MKKILTLVCCLFTLALYGQSSGPYFSINFDGVDSGYAQIIIDTVNYHHNIWQIGRPHKAVFDSAYSAPNVMVTDTANPYTVNDTSVFILKMAPHVLTNPGGYQTGEYRGLSFYYQLDIDSSAVARIEISNDSGMHWYNTQDTLPFNMHWGTYSPSIGDTIDLTQNTTGWKLFALYSSYGIGVSTILFRFTFITDTGAAAKDGWMIDHIHTEYEFEGIAQILNNNLISIYPNPSTGHIYLHTDKPPHGETFVTIYNMQSQQMYSTINVPTNGYLNLSLPQGLYTLRYTAGDEYCVKKVLIE